MKRSIQTIVCAVFVAVALSSCAQLGPNDGACVREAVANDAPYVPVSPPLVGAQFSAHAARSVTISPLQETRNLFWQ